MARTGTLLFAGLLDSAHGVRFACPTHMRSLAWFCLALAACSSSSTSTPDPNVDGGASNDAGTTIDSGSKNDAGDAGIPLDGVTKILAKSSGGGLLPPAPDGSPCTLGAQNFDYDVATKHLVYSRCVAGATSSDPYVLDQGTRDLNATQSAELDAAMANLRVTTEESCGADKATLTVTVTRPSGSTEYVDSFYSCLKDGKNYVDNIDDVFSAFNGFVGSN